jgi:hypothetical protein
MLSDYSKKMLEFGVKGVGQFLGGIDGLQEVGPARLLEHTINCAKVSNRIDVVQDIMVNRQEAERYLAGLLGMM